MGSFRHEDLHSALGASQDHELALAARWALKAPFGCGAAPRIDVNPAFGAVCAHVPGQVEDALLDDRLGSFGFKSFWFRSLKRREGASSKSLTCPRGSGQSLSMPLASTAWRPALASQCRSL